MGNLAFIKRAKKIGKAMGVIGNIKIFREDIWKSFVFDGGPYAWRRWELQGCPILFKKKGGSPHVVYNDIKRAMASIDISSAFIPDNIASWLFSQTIWELNGGSQTQADYFYFLILDDCKKRWFLYGWDSKGNNYSQEQIDYRPIRGLLAGL